jgi:hypothetical protein
MTIFEWDDRFLHNDIDYMFNGLEQVFCKKYSNVQMDKQIYVTLWTIKQGSSNLVQEYYERILKLTNGLNPKPWAKNQNPIGSHYPTQISIFLNKKN